MDAVIGQQNVYAEIKNVALLEEKIKRFEKIIDKIEEGITLSDTNGYFEIFNEKMRELTGYDQEEANRSNDFTMQIYPDPSERKRALENITETIKKGISQNFETTIQTKDKSKKTLLVSTSIISIDNRDMFLSVYTDITEQKKLQEIIKQSEERYRAIFESANDGIITLSKDGKIEDINEKASAMFGYHKKDFLGKNIKDIMHIFSLKSKMVVLKNFALRVLGKEITPYDVEMIKADGSISFVEINAVPLIKDGEIIGNLAILRDITNRKKTEDDLRRKIEELERYKNMTVGRELTMVELKKEINELCEKVGEKPRYKTN